MVDFWSKDANSSLPCPALNPEPYPMKKLSIVFLALCINLHAEDTVKTAESSPWSYSLTELVMSRYYGTWVGGVFRHNAFSFTTITARKQTGGGTLYIDGSVGRAIDSKEWNKASSDELDAEIGYSFRTKAHGWRQMDVDFHVGYIGATPLELLRDDIVSGVLTVSASSVPYLQPYVTLIRSETVGKASGSGWFAYGGFVTGVNISDGLGIRLDYRTGVALHKGIYGAGPGWVYHRLEAAVPFKAGSWTITPAVIGQIPANGQPAGRAFVDDSRLFATCSFSRPF